MTFKPLLAPREDPMSYPSYFSELKYPLLCSPKYDGIRCIIKNEIALSRTGKAIPSAQVQMEFSEFSHFDGELIVGNPTDYDVYNRTQSYIMSRDKFTTDLRYYIFDYTEESVLNIPFESRLDILKTKELRSNVILVEHCLVRSLTELLEYEEFCLDAGFEGIMMRSPFGRYKNNRGTFKEGIIYKLKRFTDSEGIILELKEQFINNNTQERDELGYAKRSTAKDQMVPANTLGSFVVSFEDDIIDVAPGSFTHEERKVIWNNQEDFIGKLVKFRYFNHGIKDKPRFPRAIGFRDLSDI